VKIDFAQNEINIDLTNTSINGGTSFLTESAPIEYESSPNQHDILKQQKVTVRIPYPTLKDMFRSWHITYNKYDTDAVIKHVQELMTMGSIIESKTADVSYYREVENTLKRGYNDLQQQVVNFEFNGKFGNTDYYLVFRPIGIGRVDVDFVPCETFDELDDETKTSATYFTIRVPFSAAPANQIDDSQDRQKLTALTSTFNTPMLLKVEDKTFVDKGFIKILPILNKLKTENKSDVLKWYYRISDFTGENIIDVSYFKEKGYPYHFYISKNAFTSSLIQVDLVASPQLLDDSTFTYGFIRQRAFFYADLLFPAFVSLETKGDIFFSVCSDSVLRTAYGPFTEGVLNPNLSEDKALIDSFNAFYDFEFGDALSANIITQNDLSWPKFEDTNSSASSSSES